MQIGSDDDCDGLTSSCVSFIANSGTNYALQIDGYSGAWGKSVLQITPCAPVNDNFTE